MFTGQNVVGVMTVVSQNGTEAAAAPPEVSNDNNTTQGELTLLAADIVR